MAQEKHASRTKPSQAPSFSFTFPPTVEIHLSTDLWPHNRPVSYTKTTKNHDCYIEVVIHRADAIGTRYIK
jgi:hypothetical protein